MYFCGVDMDFTNLYLNLREQLTTLFFSHTFLATCFRISYVKKNDRGVNATHAEVRSLDCPFKHGPERLKWLQQALGDPGGPGAEAGSRPGVTWNFCGYGF